MGRLPVKSSGNLFYSPAGFPDLPLMLNPVLSTKEQTQQNSLSSTSGFEEITQHFAAFRSHHAAGMGHTVIQESLVENLQT